MVENAKILPFNGEKPGPDSRVVLFQMEQMTCIAEDGYSLNYCRRKMNWDLPGKPAVFLFLHGAGERGAENAAQLYHGAREVTSWCERNRMKILLIFPQCPNDLKWVNVPWDVLVHSLPEESDPMRLAMTILDKEMEENDVDPSRVYIGGISMGGFGTWDALCRYPEKFTAAFPVCGGADLAMADRLKEVPILTYHGDSDSVVNTSRTRDIVAAIRKAGGTKITYVEVPDCDHNSWTPAFVEDKNWQWLFSQKK